MSVQTMALDANVLCIADVIIENPADAGIGSLSTCDVMAGTSSSNMVSASTAGSV